MNKYQTNLPAYKRIDSGVGNEPVKGCGGKDLAVQSQQKIAHIGPALTEPPAVDAGHHLVVRLALGDMFVSLGFQLLDPGHLVSGSTVVAGDLGLDDHQGADLIRNAEIRGLPETGYPLGPACLAVGNASFPKSLFNGIFHDLSHQFRDRIQNKIPSSPA